LLTELRHQVNYESYFAGEERGQGTLRRVMPSRSKMGFGAIALTILAEKARKFKGATENVRRVKFKVGEEGPSGLDAREARTH